MKDNNEKVGKVIGTGIFIFFLFTTIFMTINTFTIFEKFCESNNGEIYKVFNCVVKDEFGQTLLKEIDCLWVEEPVCRFTNTEVFG